MNKSLRNDAKNVLKKYLLILLPIIVVVLFLYSYLNNIEFGKTKEFIIEEQKQKTTILNYVIEDYFEELYQDLFIIKNSYEVNTYLDDLTNSDLDDVAQLFLRIAKIKENFDQIRIINNNGEEIVRVNNSANNPELVDQKYLQNKKDRYYYSQTSQLSENEIFVSDMDLNIEDGVIEQPIKPMFRIATPLYSKDNTYQGILIINYLGQDLLDLFTQYFQENQYGLIKPSLVNCEGYYLYNMDQDKTFGFMFENKKNINLKNESENLWNNILLNHNGLFEEDNVVTYFMELDPLAMIDTNEESNYSWYVVSSFNLNYLPSVQDSIIFGMHSIDLIIVLGICILIFILVLLNYHSQRNKGQLDVTNKIAENTNDAVMITDENTNIIYVNAAYEKATQYRPDEVIGLKPSNFKSNKQSKEFYKNMWHDIHSKGQWQGELWDRKKDGLLYPKKLSIYKTKERFSNKTRYIGIFSDVTKIKEAENDLEKLKNYHDGTNLPNENLMISLINNSIKENEMLFIVYFTIENYTQWILEVKDSNKFVKILTDSIKENIGKEDFLAQVSKNGFVVGLSSPKSIEQFEKSLHDFNNKHKHVFLYNNNEVYFDLKAGISVYPNDAQTSKELIENAFMALDYAMQTNDKRYEYYQPSLRKSVQKELQINRCLRRATQNNEFEMYYQPQTRISNEKMVGAEALIRWNSKELGFVSPGVFIPLAEKTGQIVDIGYWVIEKVMEDFLKLKEYASEDFKVSINISPVQFKDAKLYDKIVELIEKYNVDPKNFEIEITEGIFVKDLCRVNEKLNQFKKLGMTISIDDFGTGFSSLSYLKKLSIDKLKIDRSFIKDYPDKDNGDMAQVITNLGKIIELEVIAEGAETIEQVEYLNSIGCQLIQGYYYSKPLPLKQFSEYMLQNNNKQI